MVRITTALKQPSAEVLQLQMVLDEVRRLKENQAYITAQLDEATERAAALMSSCGYKTQTFGGYKYTLVAAERTKVNESGLKKALGATAFNKLTTAKLDMAKVKDAVSSGVLDPIVLAQHSEVTTNKPSFRVTEVVGNED